MTLLTLLRGIGRTSSYRSREFESVREHGQRIAALAALHMQALGLETSSFGSSRYAAGSSSPEAAFRTPPIPSRSTRTAARARVDRDAPRPQNPTERNRFLRSGARTSRLRSAF